MTAEKLTVRGRFSDLALRVLNRLTRNYEYRMVPKGTAAQPLQARQGLQLSDIYDQDLLATAANHDFILDERFQRAYQRGVRATGWDYGIQWRVQIALWASEVASHLDGDFVECGVGRGMCMSAVLENLPWASLEKRCVLIDTFLPYDLDDEGHQKADASTNPFYASSPETVAANFSEWPNVELVEGKIPEVLAAIDPFPLCYLHLDMNAAPPERAALEFFWPSLVRGGVVLFDDYGFPTCKEQKRSADEFATSVGVNILALPTGQGLIVKPPAG